MPVSYEHVYKRICCFPFPESTPSGQDLIAWMETLSPEDQRYLRFLSAVHKMDFWVEREVYPDAKE